MAASRPSNYLLSSSAPVQFKTSAVVVCLIQSMLIFTASRTAGVTHWKLEDNAITPAATDLSAGSGPAARQDDLFAMSLPSTDPEFAVLLRHATKPPPGSSASGNRGTVKSGSRACPVVSISLDGDGSTQEGGRQGCTGSGTGKSNTGVSSESVGSCGRHQCSCRGNSGSSGGSADVGCGSRGGGGEGVATARQPRNPDGSGPM